MFLTSKGKIVKYVNLINFGIPQNNKDNKKSWKC